MVELDQKPRWFIEQDIKVKYSHSIPLEDLIELEGTFFGCLIWNDT